MTQEITVIMSVYNGRKYLNWAIDSILSQTWKNFEFLIINDASEDSSREIILGYGDPRIRIIENGENLGLTKSLNIGIKQACGKFIARQDADDISYPERLEHQYALISGSRDIALVSSQARLIDSMGNDIGIWYEDMEYVSAEEIYFYLFFGNCIAHTSTMFRKDLFLKCGSYNENFKYCQDYELWTRLSKLGRFEKIRKKQVAYRVHEESVSGRRNVHKKLEEELFLRNVSLSEMPEKRKEILLGIKKENVRTSQFFATVKELTWILIEIFRKAQKNHSSFKLLALSGGKSFRVLSSVLTNFRNWFTAIMKLVLEYMKFPLIFYALSRTVKQNRQPGGVLIAIPYMVMGGAEKLILMLAHGIKSHELSADLFAAEPSNNGWKHRFMNSFDHIFDPLKLSISPVLCRKYFLHVLRYRQPGLIIIQNAFAIYPLLEQIKNDYPHIKIMDILQSEEIFRIDQRTVEKASYIDCRICVSYFLRDHLSQLYKKLLYDPDLKNRLKIIHNSVDIDLFRRKPSLENVFRNKYAVPANTILVSYLGRFSPEKRPLHFIETAKRIISRISDRKVMFVLAGEGPEDSKIQETVKSSGLSGFFILPGAIEEPAELLNDTDLLLLTSSTEGVPLTILEAMAMEVPVVASDVGAVHEIIEDGVNGFLIDVSEECSDLFAEKTLELIIDEDQRRRFGHNAKLTIMSKFSNSDMVGKYIKLISEALS